MATTSYTEFDAGIREVPGRTDSSGTAVSDLPLREDALINEVLTAGVVKPDAAFAPSKGSGDFDVDLGSGTADADLFVVESQVTGQAPYLVQLQATSITVTLDAADADPRVDEVYLVVFDAGRDSNVAGLTLPRIAVRKGDSASSPSAPGPDAEWEAWALLASVAVSGGAPSISAGDVTDERAFANMTLQGVGGIEVFTTSFDPPFTVPSGVTRIKVTLVGGGGAGGGADTTAGPGGGGGGGGGGATVIGTLPVTPGESLDFTLGLGGTGADGADGADGTASTIERDGTVLASADGGLGGSVTGNVGGVGGGGGVGGTAPSDSITINGGPGGHGSPPLQRVNGDPVAVGGSGGSSSQGNGDTPRWSEIARNGGNAGQYGKGGGGGVASDPIGEVRKGGNGHGGVVIIEW